MNRKHLLMFFLIFITQSTVGFSASPITIWTSSENVKKGILASIGSFEKDYETKVKITILSRDVTSQFKTAALTGKGPDILVWANDVIGDLAESGLIEPIKMSKSLKGKFLSVVMDAFTYKSRVYGYPYDLEAVALIYNKKLVSKVPTSMEELVKLAGKLNNKKNGTYGFLYDFKNFFFSFPFLSAGGGYIFKNRGGKLDVSDIGLANKGAIAGGKFLLSLHKDGIIPESVDRSIAFNKMKSGKLGMTIDGPWALNDLRKNKIDYGVAVIPTLNGKSPKPFVGAHGFIIRRSSKNKDLAKELIENYLVTKKGIMNMFKIDPRGPSRQDVIDIIGKKNKDLKAFIESAKRGIPMPNVPQMGAVWTSVGDALNFIISEKSTPKVALGQATKQISTSIKK